ncbi:glutamate racemase [Cetobacterium sp.]|uniref:glutamate racemase n=1 Tax=Cetobacterium sp. TaxID=2071632 RepID=UPI003F30F1F1
MRTIGVFDSGVGGVSVLKEVLRKFPADNIIYFGDSLHAPYGEKEIDEIRSLCLKVSDFLVYEKKVDALVIACNTATGAAMDIMQKRYGIPVVGVVENGAAEGVKHTHNKSIGVIATPATIKMDLYKKSIAKIDSSIKTYSVKCPLFVGMIEKGWEDTLENDELIKSYLNEFSVEIDTLILGCTHYPLIRKYIARHFNGNIIDPAEETAKSLKKIIGEGKYLHKPYLKFYASGDPEKFKKVAQEFLGQEICEVEKIIL